MAAAHSIPVAAGSSSVLTFAGFDSALRLARLSSLDMPFTLALYERQRDRPIAAHLHFRFVLKGIVESCWFSSVLPAMSRVDF